MKQYSHIRCINCGELGHTRKICKSPKVSFGIVAIHINTDNLKIKENLFKYLMELSEHEILDTHSIIFNDERMLKNFSEIKSSVKLLMIMRRHTLGYIEFIRGHYKVENPSQLHYLFTQMTIEEIQKIREHISDFDFLWKDLWVERWNSTSGNSPTNDIRNREYNISKENFCKLQKEQINLSDFLDHTKVLYDSPEWGFPKGRRTISKTKHGCIEEDIECAKREFSEETGYIDTDYIVFENISPIVEMITGFDGILYKHVYYVAMLKSDVMPFLDTSLKSQKCEIGDIGLFNVDEALSKIRPHHQTRKGIIYNICVNIIRYLLNKN